MRRDQVFSRETAFARHSESTREHYDLGPFFGAALHDPVVLCLNGTWERCKLAIGDIVAYALNTAPLGQWRAFVNERRTKFPVTAWPQFVESWPGTPGEVIMSP